LINAVHINRIHKIYVKHLNTNLIEWHIIALTFNKFDYMNYKQYREKYSIINIINIGQYRQYCKKPNKYKCFDSIYQSLNINVLISHQSLNVQAIK